MKKVLLVGPRVAEFDAGYLSAVEKSFQKLGFNTKSIFFYEPTPPGFVNKVKIDALKTLSINKFYQQYVEKFNEELLEAYHSYRPDLVFVLKGGKVKASTLEKMRDSKKVLWCYDLVRRSGVNLSQCEQYSKIFTFEKKDVGWVKAQWGLDAGYLPMGYDETVYHPHENTKKDIDVCFVGAYYPDRRKMLERIAYELSHLNLAFYGRHVRYKEPKTWLRAGKYVKDGKGHFFRNKCLDAIEVSALYNRSKICLNMHNAQSEVSCNPRVFEIMGTMGYQLVDDIPFFSKENIDCVSLYKGIDDVCRLIQTGVENHREREQMARASYEFASNNHTITHRIEQALDSI